VGWRPLRQRKAYDFRGFARASYRSLRSAEANARRLRLGYTVPELISIPLRGFEDRDALVEAGVPESLIEQCQRALVARMCAHRLVKVAQMLE
jgi:hypothetical protein